MESRVNKALYVRILLFCCCLLLFIPLLGFSLGQIYYHKAQVLLQEQEYDAAIVLLQQGAKYLPWDSQLQYSLGLAHLSLASAATGLIQELLYSIALDHLRQAEHLNPLEPKIALSIAHLLEAQGAATADAVLAAYHKAQSLAPNSVQYLSLLADKLWHLNRPEELKEAVAALGRVYPLSYGTLRQKPYWDAVMEERFSQGLVQALSSRNHKHLRRARLTLAEIKAQQQDWPAAAAQYQLALTFEPHQNGKREYLRLAEYFLRSPNLPAATELLGARMGKDAVSPQELLRLFQQAGQEAAFPNFYRTLYKQGFFSYAEELQWAEALINNAHEDLALEILSKVLKERDYLAQAWFLLATIHERQGNTEAMNKARRKGEGLRR